MIIKSRDTFDMEKTREIEQYLRWKFKLEGIRVCKGLWKDQGDLYIPGQ